MQHDAPTLRPVKALAATARAVFPLVAIFSHVDTPELCVACAWQWMLAGRSRRATNVTPSRCCQCHRSARASWSRREWS
jgi:hypothetical protein